jgi:DNA-binding transcriptional LysR family regulator
MLDATRLRVLVAVARYGSVTAAAHALNYAQPSISHHIARLEAETGAKLMERAGRGVKLTDAGQLLAQRAEEILGRLDAAEAELATHVGLRQDRVRVAAFGSALAALAPAAAVLLNDEHAGSAIHLVQAEPAEALHLLKAGEADVAIVYSYWRDGAEPALLVEAKERPGSEHQDGPMLLDEPVHLITGLDRPAAVQAELVPAQADGSTHADARAAILGSCQDQHWIATGEQCGELLLSLCHGAGFTPRVTIRTPDNTAAQSLVAAGLGVAIMPDLALRAARHPGILATKLPGVRREVRAIMYPASPDATAATRFVAALSAGSPTLGRASPPPAPVSSLCWSVTLIKAVNSTLASISAAYSFRRRVVGRTPGLRSAFATSACTCSAVCVSSAPGPSAAIPGHAPLRSHGQPAHAVVERHVVGQLATELLGVEILGRALVPVCRKIPDFLQGISIPGRKKMASLADAADKGSDRLNDVRIPLTSKS